MSLQTEAWDGSFDFKAGSKVPLCCPTFSATNNTCLAIHLFKSHPVRGRLSVLVMDNRSAKSQVFCSVGMHEFRQQPFGLVSTPGSTLYPATFPLLTSPYDLVY